METLDQTGVVAQSQSDRPCYIQFEIRPVEDRDATVEQGHYVAKDVDWVIITPPGGTLVVEKESEKWISEKRIQGDPFVDLYQRSYDEWKKGNELPTEGTPIKTWPVLSPGQIKMCLNANVRTVEDLSVANDATLRIVGMEARRVQRQAQAWLESAKDVGKTAKKLENLSVKMEQIEEDNTELRSKLKSAEEQLVRLMEPISKKRLSVKDAAAEKKSEREEGPEM